MNCITLLVMQQQRPKKSQHMMGSPSQFK